MQINNEMDMFEYLQQQAKENKVEKVNKEEFLEGIEALKTVLFIVKMKEEKNTIVFTKMFESVTVTMKEVDSGLLELSYSSSDFMEQFRNRD